ncbi:hypothetical protein BsWGS_27397 [Bradybaena similaris]
MGTTLCSLSSAPIECAPEYHLLQLCVHQNIICSSCVCTRISSAPVVCAPVYDLLQLCVHQNIICSNCVYTRILFVARTLHFARAPSFILLQLFVNEYPHGSPYLTALYMSNSLPPDQEGGCHSRVT